MKKFVFLIALIFSSTLVIAQDIVIGESGKVSTATTSADPKSLVRFYENALLHNANDPTIGNRNGTVTLAEFFDYQCIHCIAMLPVISELAEKNSNLKVVFKVYSLGKPTSTRAALAALAAEKQGKFIDFHHALLTANQPLKDEVIFSIAQASGLNLAQLQKDMNSPDIENQLNANIKLAHELKVPGTPAFFVAPSKNAGKKDATSYFVGEVSNTSLQSAVDRAAK